MKADKVWNSKMPTERLAEVLPDGSALLDAVAPPPSQTGLTNGWHPSYGLEPWLYDGGTMELMADFTSGGDTYLNGVAETGGQLYVAYTSLPEYSGYLARWSPTTDGTSANSFQVVFRASDYGGGFVLEPEAIGSNIFFIHAYGGQSVRVFDAVSGTTDLLNLEGSFGIARFVDLESHQQKLIVAGGFPGSDVGLYNPLDGSWVTHELGNVYTYIIGASGNYAFINVRNLDTHQFSSYSMNLTTGSLSAPQLPLYFATESDTGWDVVVHVGDAIYTQGNANGKNAVVKLDGSTGAMTVMLEAAAGSYLGVIDADDDSLYIKEWSSGNSLWDIYKVALDGTAAPVHYDLNSPSHFEGVVHNDSLYVRTTDPDLGPVLGVLNEVTGAVDLVMDFDASGPGQVVPLASVNGYLLVAADAENDGTLQLWSSSSPTASSSWVSLNPEVNVDLHVNLVLGSDYIM